MVLASSNPTRVYIIEAQELLVPALVEIFASLHVRVDYITHDIDAGYIASTKPDVIFLDGDYVTEGLSEGIRRVWDACPQSKLIVFCSPSTANGLNDRSLWMTASVIPKSAGRTRLSRLLERTIWMHHG